VDPRSFRLLVLRSHYRSPLEVTRETTADAEKALDRLDTFARTHADARGAEPDAAALDRFRELMDDDLKTPQSMALVFDLVNRANADGDRAAAAAAFEICGALGLELRTEVGEVPDDVLALARLRDEARAAKDWARADALRDDIQSQGYVVEDTPDGTKVRPT
jgi:cysteinyl-tRNA synthetase